jgi:hypothetical protein
MKTSYWPPHDTKNVMMKMKSFGKNVHIEHALPCHQNFTLSSSSSDVCQRGELISDVGTMHRKNKKRVTLIPKNQRFGLFL